MSLTLAGATLGAAAIGGGSSLLSNLIGMHNQNKTNANNFRIAQMNNQYNQMMFEKQLQYNTDMWNAQNAYNTPAEQMKRLKEAGINPYMALGNIQSGNAQSAGGVNPPTASPSAPMQSFTPDFSGVASAAQSYINNKLAEQMQNSQIELNDQKIDQIKIQNEYLAADFAARIENMKEQTKNWKLRSFYQGVQNRYAADMFAGQRDNIIREGQMQEQAMRARDIDMAIQKLHLHNIPRQYQLTFASIAADILETEARTEKEWAAVYTELEKGFKEAAAAFNIRLTNTQLVATVNDLIAEAKANAKKAGIAADFEGLNQITGLVGNVINGYSAYKSTLPTKKHTYGNNRGKYYDIWEVNY